MLSFFKKGYKNAYVCHYQYYVNNIEISGSKQFLFILGIKDLYSFTFERLPKHTIENQWPKNIKKVEEFSLEVGIMGYAIIKRP